MVPELQESQTDHEAGPVLRLEGTIGLQVTLLQPQTLHEVGQVLRYVALPFLVRLDSQFLQIRDHQLEKFFAEIGTFI